jgi:hypothetical protein
MPICSGRHDLRIKVFSFTLKWLPKSEWPNSSFFSSSVAEMWHFKCHIKLVACKASDSSSCYWYKYMDMVELDGIWFFVWSFHWSCSLFILFNFISYDWIIYHFEEINRNVISLWDTAYNFEIKVNMVFSHENEWCENSWYFPTEAHK